MFLNPKTYPPIMKSLIKLIVILFFPLLANAQKWEIGANAGWLHYEGDINDVQSKALPTTISSFDFGGGLFVRNHATNTLAIRANFLTGKLHGVEENFTAAGHEWRKQRKFSFSSPIREISLVLEYDIFGNRRFQGDSVRLKFTPTFSPYIFVGGGFAAGNPTVDFNDKNAPNPIATASSIATDKASTKSSYFVLPIGGGFKYDLTKNWVLGTEIGLRPTFADYLDGISVSGNPKLNDVYVYGSLNLSYRLSFIKDRDKDGVPDDRDGCINEPGSPELNGCPDSDGDGVADKADACPNQEGKLKGCPDKDEDGIADKEDTCPDIAGTKRFNGCPDTDGDGIADKEDACPEVAGLEALKGCPDKDNDGITDREDKCPEEYGIATNGGCPIIDKDGDGVIDKQDRCPEVPGLAKFAGCPDSDGDGIADPDDKCPTTAGIAAEGGCPKKVVISSTDREVLRYAMSAVQFETSRAILKQNSQNILNEIVNILNRYPSYALRINGYTDNVGNDFVNQQLSQERAKTCYDYFVKRGIAANRLKYNGFGENSPIADNNTIPGRAKNRRVEFELY
jgi:outer membrane protein OmpA-like peptidoglycan-associated protein/opacity protein-like surface antigen